MRQGQGRAVLAALLIGMVVGTGDERPCDTGTRGGVHRSGTGREERRTRLRDRTTRWGV